MSRYIGVDLDGTLAVHTPEDDVDKIGAPIPDMVARVRAWLAEGKQVRIITARVADRYADRVEQHQMIQAWCLEHIGQALVVQSHKCGAMTELWDDRAVGVVRNTGLRTDEVAVDDAVGKILTYLENEKGGSQQSDVTIEHLQANIALGVWKK